MSGRGRPASLRMLSIVNLIISPKTSNFIAVVINVVPQPFGY